MVPRFAALAFLMLAVMGASLLVGGTPLAITDIGQTLLHPYRGGALAIIVWQLRVPRICIAAIVGAALAVTGAMMQGLLRNPLIDPYLTGVSAGAAAAIAIATLAGASPALLPGLGFAAGVATAILVAALARRGSGIDANRLILAGISLSALFSAIVAFAIARAQSADYAQAILSWLAGSMASRTWRDLVFTAPYLAAGAALAVVAIPSLNALRIGDVRARSVGVDVDKAQWIILASSSLLAAASVSLAGIVGFVGLIVPHVARRLVGSDARVLLAACALLGAALTVLSDAVARTIVAPSELPIGVLLAFIGVPAFLYLYLHRKGAM
ncbi:MAG: iron ABC transporter permease [Candidatus Eremiobacteraeota bacterium]|nr:iron ABC transporter permease [Candidatus Eremiobacteraeota bacterium]